VPASVGAGPGSGSLCNLCGCTIEHEQVEYDSAGTTQWRFGFISSATPYGSLPRVTHGYSRY